MNTFHLPIQMSFKKLKKALGFEEKTDYESMLEKCRNQCVDDAHDSYTITSAEFSKCFQRCECRVLGTMIKKIYGDKNRKLVQLPCDEEDK